MVIEILTFIDQINLPCILSNTECASVSEIQRLRNIVAKLRAPDGCPWDREQTHQSLLRCLVEEVSEVLEAIDNEDDELMEEELGDLLLQVVMHARLAEERKSFNLDDVARGISDKLIRRHPHVFGEKSDTIDSSDKVLDQWEKIKALEKKEKGQEDGEKIVFKNLPPRLPALLFSMEIYKKALKNSLQSKGQWSEERIEKGTHGFDDDMAGRSLFEIVAKCHKNGIDPETALRKFAAGQVDFLEQEYSNS